MMPPLMNHTNWTPFKQYVVKNDYILQANDIWLYFMPPECGVFERDLKSQLSDPVLPCDLDHALPRLQWVNFDPEVKIRDVLANRDGFNLLITPCKRTLWLRNSMDILNNRDLMKRFNGVNIMRRNAIVADYLNAFTADKVHSHTCAAMVIHSLTFSNLDHYDLDDTEFILSIEKVAHSIIEKRSVHFDD
jgi:hypothetical protein